MPPGDQMLNWIISCSSMLQRVAAELATVLAEFTASGRGPHGPCVIHRNGRYHVSRWGVALQALESYLV